MPAARIYFILIILLVPTVFAVTCHRHDKTLYSNFYKIIPGDSQESVTIALGDPKFQPKGCKWEFVQSDIKNCSEVYVYASMAAPWIPVYPTIWFDSDKKVISTYVYHSP